VQKNFSLVWKNTLPKEAKKPQDPVSFPTSALVKRVIQYSNEIKDQTIVIKLDSAIIEDQVLLTNFAENISILRSCGANPIIVHDYTKLVESSLRSFGIDKNVITNMQSIDSKNAQLVEMVLSGHVNKMIVSKLCEFGCYAIGISGKDGNLIQAKKSTSTYKRHLDGGIIDIGFVSQPVVLNPEILLNFEDMDIIPIISPIACDNNKRTHILDVNLTASVISSAIGADHLVFSCSNEILKGNYLKIYDTRALKNIWQNNQGYKDHSLFEAAYNSIEHSSNTVHFVDAHKPDSILLSFFPNG
jgi:acetylglutamate kinase